jgi:hypothetical protein
MKRLNKTPRIAAILVAAATAVACNNSSDPSRAAAPELRAINFELLPLARTCPATTPVNIGGPGVPATYSLVYKVTIANDTDEPVTVSTVSSAGSVVAATNGVGVGRSAHVFNLASYPSLVVAPGTPVEITGPITALCGDNPIITQSTFWDIATQLNISTSGGPLSSSQLTFRRNWMPCDAGHPCPVSQPPLPSN